MKTLNTYKYIWSCCVLFGTSIFTSTQAQALDPEKIFAKVSPSIVEVMAGNPATNTLKQGSGVVIQDERVITNCHVLTKTTSILVKWGEAKLIATLEYPDVERDLCQIKVPSLKAPAVPIAPDKSLKIGQRVYAIGNPMGLELTFSEGLISSFRIIDGVRKIQTTADITHGSSGGGLFDDHGRLIGITTSGYKEGNLNFAVPASYLKDLPERGKAQIEKLVGKTPPAIASSPTSVPVLPSSPSATHVLTGSEILAHFSRYKKLDAKPKHKPEFQIAIGDDGFVRRYCDECHSQREDGRMTINVAAAQVCFDWDRATYPTSGCFTLEQIADNSFSLHLVNGEEIIDFTAEP